MPRVKPFRGVFYAPGKVPLAKVVTEPYDKITPSLQEEYYQHHPLNFVRLILGKIFPTDDAKNNRYRRAAKLLDEWIAQGILRPDGRPAYYLYEQTFRRPALGTKKRLGIIGLLRLEDFSKGNVLPHERTLAKPRKDRLSLLKATQANLEQVFLLYEDARGRLQGKLEEWTKAKPFVDFRDSQGVRQRLWRITQRRDVALVSRFLSGRTLFIADGHHRYTISYLYHKQQMASPKVPAALKENSAWRMATFVNMHSDGLVILPTHRLVKMPAGWNFRSLLEDLREDFYVETFPIRGGLVRTATDLIQKIGCAAGAKKTSTFGLLAKTGAAVLRLRSDREVRKRLAPLNGLFRTLDVAILHHLVLQKRLHIDPISVERGGQIAYIREPQVVARKISSGEYALGFLQNPADVEQVRRIALAGKCMPQKSTDFYPKLLSGLVVYDMKGRRVRG